MTATTKLQTAWRRRSGTAALGAVFAAAMIFGPGTVLVTRLGVGETVGFATVSAADTITSSDMFADVPAGGVSRQD